MKAKDVRHLKAGEPITIKESKTHEDVVSVAGKRPLSSLSCFLTGLGLLTFIICIIVSTLFICRSNTGDIDYRPVREDLINEQLGRNVKLAILEFPDKRPVFKGFFYSRKLGSKPKHDQVGAFWGKYMIAVRKLYSNQAITLEVIDALADFFEANGFRARKYYGPGVSVFSDERLCVKGQINEFFINGSPAWTGIAPGIQAVIDIDVMIVDTKYQRTIWAGKINSYRKMGKHKGVFTGASKIFSFFNLVFSKAIEKAWVDDGMLKALGSLSEKAPLKRNQ